jgi:hypothetical protein
LHSSMEQTPPPELQDTELAWTKTYGCHWNADFGGEGSPFDKQRSVSLPKRKSTADVRSDANDRNDGQKMGKTLNVTHEEARICSAKAKFHISSCRDAFEPCHRTLSQDVH